MWGITSVQWGITSVLWRVFSTLGDTFSTVGDTFSTVGDNISTVEVAQYSGDRDLKYYELSKNLEIFCRAYFTSKPDRPHHRTQLLTAADMFKDLGYKNLVLGKILLSTYNRLGFWKYFVKFFGNCGRICEYFMI